MCCGGEAMGVQGLYAGLHQRGSHPLVRFQLDLLEAPWVFLEGEAEWEDGWSDSRPPGAELLLWREDGKNATPCLASWGSLDMTSPSELPLLCNRYPQT